MKIFFEQPQNLYGANRIIQGAINHLSVEATVTPRIREADLCVFFGGADVHPKLYHQEVHPLTALNIDHDLVDIALLKSIMRRGCPTIGICRGAQFLTVMAGGRLVQHITGHSVGDHKIQVADKLNFTYNNTPVSELKVTSTHHQMMFPFTSDESFKLLGWAKKLSTAYELTSFKDQLINVPCEPELVVWPKRKFVCAQYHPEMQGATDVSMKLLFDAYKEVC